jgi:TldD protein
MDSMQNRRRNFLDDMGHEPSMSPITPASRTWSRRAWVQACVRQHVIVSLAVTPAARFGRRGGERAPAAGAARSLRVTELPEAETLRAPDDAEALAQWAVDAAMHAGAQYADVRLTRTVQHHYSFGGTALGDWEDVGIGVRALVNGYWGFAAYPSGDRALVEQLARDAVAQATANGRGAVTRTVDLGHVSAVTGRWATPVALDPFAVPLEEKQAFMRYWLAAALKEGVNISAPQSFLHFVGQTRTVATSEGSRYTQTAYESGGKIMVGPWGALTEKVGTTTLPVQGIGTAGRGWEMFLGAKIPEQLRAMPERLLAAAALQRNAEPLTVGRYTLVCDGATMAAVLNATLGVATQLDRALGYEANAGGTSFITDPLAMLGTFQVASSLVTVSANRSAQAQLATVKWDDEGVTPPDVVLLKNGVLTDVQTTREQATWLAPYYAKSAHPVRSNGDAAAQDALKITLQHTPNLALEPSPAAVRLEDLIANVPEGILVEEGSVMQADAQARNGLLVSPNMRHIKNGRLGAMVTGGAILFNTIDFWKHVMAVGGPSTRRVVPFSQYQLGWGGEWAVFFDQPVKGEPPQWSSHSVQAAAATVANQPVINPEAKA